MCGCAEHSGNQGWGRKERENGSGYGMPIRFQLWEGIHLEIRRTPHYPETVQHYIPFERTGHMFSVFNPNKKRTKAPRNAAVIRTWREWQANKTS